MPLSHVGICATQSTDCCFVVVLHVYLQHKLNLCGSISGCWLASNKGRMWLLQIIETKVKKLEQLVRLKDAKIQTLIAKMQAAGLA